MGGGALGRRGIGPHRSDGQADSRLCGAEQKGVWRGEPEPHKGGSQPENERISSMYELMTVIWSYTGYHRGR